MLGLNTLSLFILSSNVNCYVEQNPNVAFDFDHWEDCDEDKEDSHFAKGKRRVHPLPRMLGPEHHGGGCRFQECSFCKNGPLL